MADLNRKERSANRELATIKAMVGLHCCIRHGGRRQGLRAGQPCPDCAALLEYSAARLAACPFLRQSAGPGKPSCRVCPVHCYRPAEREAVRAIMRWAGPRMLVFHPLKVMGHLMRDRLSKSKDR